MNEQPQQLSSVIGANARRIRRGSPLTLDEVAVEARKVGLKWSEARVADFEAGRVAATLPTLLAYCSAMAALGCKIRVADLLAGDGDVAVNDDLTVPREVLSGWLRGKVVLPPQGGPQAQEEKQVNLGNSESEDEREWRVRHFDALWKNARASHQLLVRAGAAEERVRRSVGFSPEGFAMLSHKMWGRTFSEERDARAEKGSTPQARGQVSRVLQSEVRQEVDGDGVATEVASPIASS